MGKKRVFLVDDHAIARMGLRRLIESKEDLTVCGEAADGPEALQELPRAKPDVLVADLSLHGQDMSGLELIKAVKTRHPRLPVLVISMHDESVYAEHVFRSGARGYLMKSESAEKVLDAVRMVLAGKIYMSPLLSERMLDEWSQGEGAGASPADRLSDRELEVFQLIGQGLKPGRIAEKLHLSVKTVESYREHIKVKLNLDDATDLVRYAIEWVHRTL